MFLVSMSRILKKYFDKKTDDKVVTVYHKEAKSKGWLIR